MSLSRRARFWWRLHIIIGRLAGKLYPVPPHVCDEQECGADYGKHPAAWGSAFRVPDRWIYRWASFCADRWIPEYMAWVMRDYPDEGER